MKKVEIRTVTEAEEKELRKEAAEKEGSERLRLSVKKMKKMKTAAHGGSSAGVMSWV